MKPSQRRAFVAKLCDKRCAYDKRFTKSGRKRIWEPGPTSRSKLKFYSRRGASGGVVVTTGPQETPTARSPPDSERISPQGGGRRTEFQDTHDHAAASSSSHEAFQRTLPSSAILPAPASWAKEARVSNTAPIPTPAKVRLISKIWQNSSMSKNN